MGSGPSSLRYADPIPLIAATTRHTASGITGTTGSIGKLAKMSVLPPTLTVQ